MSIITYVLIAIYFYYFDIRYENFVAQETIRFLLSRPQNNFITIDKKLNDPKELLYRQLHIHLFMFLVCLDMNINKDLNMMTAKTSFDRSGQN